VSALVRGLLLGDLLRDEGMRLAVYDDATGKVLKPGMTLLGNPTIGIGRNLVDRGISREEAALLCEADLDLAAAELDRALPWWRRLAEGRQRALWNMAFNLGLPRLLGFKAMLAALEAGRWEAAAEAALDSRWALQVGPRAERIAALLREG
jgi:lysozyme